MKRRTVILKRILPCIAALLVLANCKNLFQPQELPPAQTGEGTFSLKIGGIRAGRTILPATVKDDFAAYTLLFQADGQTGVSAERTNETLDQAISLPAGTWNLTVTAFMDSEKTKPAAQGSITGITISGGENTSGSLELKPIIEADATGTFRWNIDYPDDVTLARMTITPLDEATGTAAQTLYFVGGETLTDKNNWYTPLELNTGYYRVVFNLSKGIIETGRVEYLHIYKNLESPFEYAFTQDHFTVYSVVSGADSGPGSLRYAIANAVANSTILVEVETINLESRLEISKNLTIRGNGVTLTRSAAWTATSETSQLLYIYDWNAAITVNISRVHFKNGRATDYGAAVRNSGETVNLESCIFSGNQTSEGYSMGGAIYTSGPMSVKGCTFYNNGAPNSGGAIYNWNGTLTLTGNLFYGNTAASGPVVNNDSGTVTSNGYNVVDVALGTGTDQSGWEPASGDKTITAGSWPVSPVSFRLSTGSEAGGVITTLPSGYPAADFYGAAISSPAAAGAVQAVSSGVGYILILTVNNSARGAISATPAPDADGFVSPGQVTITASPADGYFLDYWLVDGLKNTSPSPLNLTISDHTVVQAVFGILVTDFTDTANSATTPGTLRYALTNVEDGGIIRFTGVTAGTTTIELGYALPQVSKNITIEGNGVTLTRSAAWTETSYNPQLLRIYYGTPDSAITVNISRVHFKNGRATTNGAAIYNNGVTVNLESCIFSGNQSSASDANGGAILNYYGTMNVKGCTFYNNSSAYRGGAICNDEGTLTLTGNLFYGNTAPANSGPVVYNVVYYTNGTLTSGGYNAVDVALGTGTDQSGWSAATGDKTITAGSWPVSPVSFRLSTGSEAGDVITTLPSGYPAADFYGTAISSPAAAGAVQAVSSGVGYILNLTVNNSSRGSISATPAPDTDGYVSGGTAAISAVPQDGYFFGYWLVNNVNSGSANPLSLSITAHTTVRAVFTKIETVSSFTDTASSATTPGTLRYALTNVEDGGIIRFTGVTAENNTIALGSALPQVTRSITIEGNGVTLTRSAAWTATSSTSQLLYIPNSSADITVNISRVHFKNGRENYGAAIYNSEATVNLESCIFSGNQTSASYAYGGAVFNDGTMNIKGCTFYNNSSPYGGGGAIYNYYGTLTLTGNLFYGNTATTYPVVYNYSGTVTSGGYNATDVDLGTGTDQSGWEPASGDKTITAGTLPVSWVSFKPLSGSGAGAVITTLPTDYPAMDFYGAAIADGAAAGAVQGAVSGLVLDLSVNNSSLGSISSTPAPDADGLIPAGTAVTITASPAEGCELEYWLVNGTAAGSTNPLSLTISGHTTVQAVFARVVTVTNFSDAATPGTLRYALTNGQDGDIIRFTGVTAGTTTIELGSALPQVTKNVTIQGNGVTLTRSAAWTETSNTPNLLYIYSSSAAITVNISRVHFKNGGATTNGSAVYAYSETVNLESCIFSGNQNSSTHSSSGGGAINNQGTMNVKGCTFYNNSSAYRRGGAIYHSGGTLTLTGNLFYGNTAAADPVVSGGTVTSNGYNVVDVDLGTGTDQSGWTAATGDTTFTALGINISEVDPFDTTTFAPVTGLNSVMPSTALTDFPAVDFNGAARTWPGAPGAVKQ